MSFPYDPQGARDVTVITIFCAIAILLITLRFRSRYVTRTGYELDDWMAFLATIFYLGTAGCTLAFNLLGGEIDLVTLPPDELVRTLQTQYAADILAALCAACAKLSVLYLYTRIFAPNRKLLIAVYIMYGVVVAWLLSGTLSVVFQCTPIRKAWEPALPGYCISLGGWILGIEIPNSMIDFIMIAIPIPVIRALHLPRRLKLAISAIFLLGMIVGIVGLIRVGAVYSPIQINYYILGILTQLELLLGVFCCCLPVMRSLLPRNESVFNFMHGLGTSLKSLVGNFSNRVDRTSTLNSGSDTSQKSGNTNKYKKYSNGGSEDNISMIGITSNQQGSHTEGGKSEHGGIMINREFEVSHAV